MLKLKGKSLKKLYKEGRVVKDPISNDYIVYFYGKSHIVKVDTNYIIIDSKICK